MTEPAEMTQVNVSINGRVYRMACEGGQEAHLQGLALKLDGLIDQLRGSFGEIGDQRLTVMAAIMAMDEMSDLHRQIRDLQSENRALRESRTALLDQQSRIELAVAREIDATAGRLERLAASLTAAKPAGGAF